MAALAFVISRVVLAGVVHWVTTSFPPDIGSLRLAVPAADWRVALRSEPSVVVGVAKDVPGFWIGGMRIGGAGVYMASRRRSRRHVARVRGSVEPARRALVDRLGLLLGASLTAGFDAILLATPAAELIGSTVRLFDPLAYGASLLVIVAACAAASLVPALRAGRANPLAALSHD